MARARSAHTRPSAPSATPATGSGRPGLSISAGDRAMPNSSFQGAIWLAFATKVELTHPPEHGRVDVFGHARFPRHPRQQVAVGKLNEALEIGKLVVAQLPHCRISKTAHDQIHLAHAPMPASKQEFAATQIKTVARAFSHQWPPTPKARTGRVDVI